MLYYVCIVCVLFALDPESDSKVDDDDDDDISIGKSCL